MIPSGTSVSNYVANNNIGVGVLLYEHDGENYYFTYPDGSGGVEVRTAGRDSVTELGDVSDAGSGEIITNLERQRLIPDVINVDSNSKSEYLADNTAVSNPHWEFQFSGPNHDKSDILGSVVRFNANSLSLGNPIRITLPVSDTSFGVGWHLFAQVIEGGTSIEMRLETGSGMEPFPKVDVVPGFMAAAYNIKYEDGQNNYWSAIGNIIDAS